VRQRQSSVAKTPRVVIQLVLEYDRAAVTSGSPERADPAGARMYANGVRRSIKAAEAAARRAAERLRGGTQ